MHQHYQPSGDYLLVKLDKSIEDIKSEQSKVGEIIIPASVKEGEVAARPVAGTVVAAGPDATLGRNPYLLPQRQIVAGDRVDFFLFRGFPRVIEDVHYIQINANQILGILGTPVVPVAEVSHIRN